MELLRAIVDVAGRDGQRPCVTAVDGETTDYATVVDRARRLAGGLSRHLPGPGVPVLFSTDSLLDRVTLELACLLLATPFVPLRPEASAAYAHDVSTALGQVFVTGSGACVAPLSPRSLDALADAAPLDLSTGHRTDGGAHAGGQACAYVMFTSGSSGRPKGVRVPRRALDAYCTSFVAVAGITHADTSLVLGAQDFDVSIEEVFPFLMAGARLAEAVPGARTSPLAVTQEIARSSATTVFVPPLVCETLFHRDWHGSTLRLLRTGGERLATYPPRGFPVRVLNEYGPTETTVAATCCDLTGWSEQPGADLERPPPIGRPLPHVHTRLHDVDEQGRGELVVAGAGVALGYTDPDLDTPFAVAGGTELEYHTGDIVSIDADGVYHFHGRNDRQVQVGGVRLELDAVERAVLDDDGVEAAAATVMTDGHGRAGAVVVGYVAGAVAPEEARLGQRVRASMASPRLPLRLYRLESLPLDARGKTDYALVLAAGGQVPAEHPHESRPGGFDVEAVCRVFTEVLGEPVSAATPLFSYGLTSRTAEEAARRLQEESGTPCTARDVFMNPAPAELCDRLQAVAREQRGGPSTSTAPRGE